MAAEPTVPVARLEKLWRRLQRKGHRFYAQANNPQAQRGARSASEGWSCGLMYAAADLRAIINEAKGKSR